MNRVIGFGGTLLLALVGIFVVLFLGGLASAALEVRAERRAGVPVARPAWENRAKRRAAGGWRASIRNRVSALSRRGSGFVDCWCGCGPIHFYEGMGDDLGDGWGCLAWESQHAVAILRHDAAGGYSRTPRQVAA